MNHRHRYSETSLTGAKDSVDVSEYYLRDVALLDEDKEEELGFVPHWLKSKQEFAFQLLPKPKDGPGAAAADVDQQADEGADEGLEAFILFATDATQKDKWFSELEPRCLSLDDACEEDAERAMLRAVGGRKVNESIHTSASPRIHACSSPLRPSCSIHSHVRLSHAHCFRLSTTTMYVPRLGGSAAAAPRTR
jgi:hypothetical protein